MTDDDDEVIAGLCPTHGIVSGEDVEFNFPNPSTCVKCGKKLTRCGFADEDEVEEHATH